MADPRLFRLRVVFRKTGRLRMLSHLEIARALERAVRRAKLPFAVSQGFSPHMRIAFGAALPVGVGGTAEYFDLFLERYVAPDVALVALQAASAVDLAPTSCAYVEHSAPAASVAFPVSAYEAELSHPVERLIVPDAVTVVRKKKEKTLVVSEFVRGAVEVSGARVRFELEAKPTGSLRPDVFLSACVKATVDAGAAPHGLRVVGTMRTAQRSLSGEML